MVECKLYCFELIDSVFVKVDLKVFKQLVVDVSSGIVFIVKLVKLGDMFDSNVFYVDEVVLMLCQGMYCYGLVEVLLLLGVEVEVIMWGIQIDGLKGELNEGNGVQLFECKVVYEMGQFLYNQLVFVLECLIVLCQLVCFLLLGCFVLLLVCYFCMYQLEVKVFQGDGKMVSYLFKVE